MKKLKLQKFSVKKQFTITIMSNKNCNFNCTYCYEKGKFENLDLTDEKIENIINFLKINFKNTRFEFMLIGGEPTISKKLKDFIQEVEKNFNDSTYHLITNGSSIHNILNLFPTKEIRKKVFLQISYDGKVINDIDRIILKDNKKIPTSNIVLKTLDEAMKYFNKNNISLKSTLNIKYLDKVPKVLKEFRELSKYYNTKFDYTPSEVKTIIHYMKKEEIKKIIKEIFPKILQEEIKNKKELGYYLTTWLNNINFKNAGAFCTAGIDSLTISTNLDILYCHRSEFYNDNNEFNYGNLKDQNIFQDYLNNRNKLLMLQSNFYDNPICKNCTAIYCQKCPAELAEIQSLKTFNNMYNAWNDNICFYYQEISKYLYYFMKKYNNYNKGEINGS